MTKTLMSIKEVAAILSVSQQTIRNWEESGILRATRTVGGHRRYSQEAIDALRKPTCSFAYEYDRQMFDLEMSRYSHEYPKGTPVNSPYPARHLNFLIEKFRTHQLLQPPDGFIDEDCYNALLHRLAAPYLVHCKPMLYPITLAFYERIRHNNLVIESQEVCSRSEHKEFVNFVRDPNIEVWQRLFANLLEDIDLEIVQDLVNNAGTIYATNGEIDRDWGKIHAKIHEILNFIEKKTGSTGSYWAILSPEMTPANFKTKVKIAHNLYLLGISNGVTYYMSRYMKEHQVLIGCKDPGDRMGYLFTPYCLAIYDYKRSWHEDRAMVRYGKKLMREGAKYFGLIDFSRNNKTNGWNNVV
jgi:excisionase family DNA binding protein